MNSEHSTGASRFVLDAGMGSGKTTAGKIFTQLGAEVIDSDDVVRELRQPGESGHEIMTDVLGDDIVLDDGTLDTEIISNKIFADESLHEREQIEERLYPFVWEAMHQRADALPASRIAIFEVPVFRHRTDDITGVLAIITDQELAIERTAANRGFSEAEIIRRLNSQPSNEERRARADYVVENNGSHQEYEIALGGAWRWMCGEFNKLH